jgi:hypothetical protein
METREQARQAHGGRGLHGADAQRAAGRALILRGLLGFAHQREDALGIGQQPLARGGQRHAAAVALEERQAELLLQLLDARGDVGGHGGDVARSRRDAARAGHGGEGGEAGEVHPVRSPIQIVAFWTIQFHGMADWSILNP